MSKIQEIFESSEEPNLNEGGVSRESIKNEVELSPSIIKEEDPTTGKKADLMVEVPSASKTTDAASPSKTPLTSSSKLSRKSNSVIEPAKKHHKSYVLAFLASLSFGMANYYMSDLSMRKGLLGIPCQSFGFVLMWAFYYVYRLIMHKVQNNSRPFFDRRHSQYYEEFVDESQPSDNNVDFEKGESQESKAFYELTWHRFSAPLYRGICQLMIQLVIVQCFEFAARSGVNGGIISAIFSSSSLFSIVIFYFKYG